MALFQQGAVVNCYPMRNLRHAQLFSMVLIGFMKGLESLFELIETQKITDTPYPLVMFKSDFKTNLA